ncbi:hypothetical protein C8F01DRAFT_1121252 [Mycena amicta]|nr:hypothetical protein C8F01DRAFT_1121252 [Mycena amicta]
MDFPRLPDVPSSPCPELLSSNSQPTDSLQTVGILQSIRTAEDEITSLDNGIVQLENALRQFHARRKELQAFVHSHRGVLSSRRRVPEDVWCEIFERVVDNSDKSGHFDLLCTLSSVCRPWRNIVLATPLLWRQIHIGVPVYSTHREGWQRNFGQVSQRATLQLARSSGVPLTLLIDAFSMPADPTYLALWDLLLSRAKQWHIASLQLSEEHLDHIASSGKSFPALTTLALALSQSFTANVNRFFAAFPALRDLTLDAAYTHLSLSVQHTPWTHLQICELRFCSFADIITVLPLLSLHSTLSLVTCSPAETEHTLSPVHSQASALSFTSCGETLMVQLMSILTTPNLTALGLHHDGSSHIKPSHVLDFLRRSQCSLKHIALDLHVLLPRDDVDLRELFESEFIRDAIHLDCQLRFDAINSLRLASLLAENGALLPVLRVLTVRLPSLHRNVLRPFLQELGKIRRSTLRQLWIEQDAELFDDEESLQELQDAGVEVYWRRCLADSHLRLE